MKRILFTAAIEEELICARMAYRELFQGYKGLDDTDLTVDYLITGIGSTSTSYHLTKTLTSSDFIYDLVVNIGIAGTYTEKYPIGTVVRVVKEQFGDMGVESRLGFQSLFDHNILDANTLPYRDGALYSPFLDIEIEEALKVLPSVSGLTVQTLKDSIEGSNELVKRFKPDVESMEGAAFFYVALMEKLPFIELRAVSNFVGERNKEKWNTPLALSNLKTACKTLLKAI